MLLGEQTEWHSRKAQVEWFCLKLFAFHKFADIET